MDPQLLRDIADAIHDQYPDVDPAALVQMVLSGQIRVDQQDPATAMLAAAERMSQGGGTAAPTATPSATASPSPTATATPGAPQGRPWWEGLDLNPPDNGEPRAVAPTATAVPTAGPVPALARPPDTSQWPQQQASAAGAGAAASAAPATGAQPTNPKVGDAWANPLTRQVVYWDGMGWDPDRARATGAAAQVPVANRQRPPAPDASAAPASSPTAQPPAAASQTTAPATATAPAAASTGRVPDRATAEKMARAAAVQAGVDPGLYVRLVINESGFGNAISSAGARGPAQLMPGTAAALRVNIDDYQQNLEGGARYLKQMLDQFGGNPQKAVTAYNMGPGWVARNNIASAPQATRDYVSRVTGSNLDAGTPQNATGAVDSGGGALSRLTTLANPAGTVGGQPTDKNGDPWNIRPFAGLNPGTMTPQEGEHYFPWNDAAQGGQQQATYNVLTGMGVNPNNGNPWNSFLEGIIPSIHDSAWIKNALSGAMPSQDQNAADTQLTMNTLRQGNTSAFSNFGDMIKQLVGASKQTDSGGTDQSGNSLPIDALIQTLNQNNGAGAASTLDALTSPFLSPMLRTAAKSVIQNRLNQFRQQGMDQGSMSPIDYLTRGWLPAAQ